MSSSLHNYSTNLIIKWKPANWVLVCIKMLFFTVYLGFWEGSTKGTGWSQVEVCCCRGTWLKLVQIFMNLKLDFIFFFTWVLSLTCLYQSVIRSSTEVCMLVGLVNFTNLVYSILLVLWSVLSLLLKFTQTVLHHLRMKIQYLHMFWF